jgi:[ribosomal protein S5]-alanine N-acetyltransferase
MVEGPVIETPRLRIVPFSETHLTMNYVNWLNDPEVVRFSEQRHLSHTIESCRLYWLSYPNSPNYFWAITVSEGRFGHIGNINAYVDEKNRLADVGILIGEKAAWHQGYGLEAWNAVCNFLLEVAEMRKITAGTLADNKGMLRIMERSGMVADGHRVRHYSFEGKETDIVYWALFNEKLRK